MKKKGFTLVELLAVIVILGLIFMFIVPRLSTLIKNGEIKEKEVLETKIINASKEYVSSYNRNLYDNLVDVGDYNYVCVNNLLDNKLIDASDLKELENIVGIKFELEENDKIKYEIEYGEDSSLCDNTLINLTVELNGGTLTNNIEKSYSKESTVELGIPTKEGATFNKWVVTRGSATIEGNVLKMHYTDVTIYALYTSLTTLTVDKNGGSSTQEFEDKYETGTIIELQDLTKKGYNFTGWEVVSGDSILSGKRITIGLEPTEIRGMFDLGSYTCQAGKYLKAGEVSCEECPIGSYCPGGTYPYNPDEDQGINKCPAGTYSIGSASSCTLCVEGSTSSAGASSCTACPNGKTTSGAGQSSCNANCDNASNVSTWVDANWNSDNTMSNLCIISTCNSGYGLNGNFCGKTITVTFNYNKASWNANTTKKCNLNSSGKCSVTSPTIPNYSGRTSNSSNKPLSELFSIKGWSTNSTDTTATYSVSSSVEVTNNTTLYAIVTLTKSSITISTSNGDKLYIKSGPGDSYSDVYQSYGGNTYQSYFNNGENIGIQDFQYTGAASNPMWLKYQRADVWFTAQSVTW